jgi:hypothetical protein
MHLGEAFTSEVTMEQVHKLPDKAAELPGPLYPDRCLECPELLCDGYGCVRHNKCVDCVAADRRRKRQQPQSCVHTENDPPEAHFDAAD